MEKNQEETKSNQNFGEQTNKHDTKVKRNQSEVNSSEEQQKRQSRPETPEQLTIDNMNVSETKIETKNYEDKSLTDSIVNIQPIDNHNITNNQNDSTQQQQHPNSDKNEEDNVQEEEESEEDEDESEEDDDNEDDDDESQKENSKKDDKPSSRPSSPPPPSDTSLDLNTSNNEKENNIIESIIEIQSIDHTQTSLNSNTDDKNSISKSTVVLTTSQILTETETNSDLDKCVELENINKEALILSTKKEESNINTDSMIVTSGSSSFVSSPVQPDKPDFNSMIDSQEGENHKENMIEILEDTVKEKTKENDVKEIENLVKEYIEIPNYQTESLDQEVSSKIKELKTEIESQTSAEQVQTAEKPKEKKIEDEQYQKILGNDSLMKKTLQYGDSIVGRPLNGQMVTIDYEAYLKENHKLVDHNEDHSFILGDGDVISGMDMIISLMDKGEKCEMIVEPRHAYGNLGKQPDIPPEATLVYKIHLKDFNDVTDFNQMGPVERLSLAEAKKLRGNFHYNRQDFSLAIMSYKKGLKYFDEENLKGDEEDKDLEKFLEVSQALLMNTALSYFKMGECREALDSLDKVLNAQGTHIKALYIKGKVLLQMGETQDAVKTLSLAIQLDPTNQDIQKELAKAQAKHKIQYENEKKMYQKMISGVGKKDADIKKSIKAKNKTEKSYMNYLAAGVAVAAASIGFALFARYKNIF